jgi:O-antigen/teichoic acid export membrane protein
MNGFVAGDMEGKLFSAGRCAAEFWSSDRPYLLIYTRNRVTAAARRYAHVARYTLPDQLINNLAGSIHVIFLGTAFGTAELGYVTLVLSILYFPVTVVSTAVKDVFRQRASLEYQLNGTCRPTYRRLVVPIALLALIGFGTMYVAAPWLFPLVLGSDWSVAGNYARILVPMFFWNFVSMSLGGVMVIAERTDISLVWQVLNLFLTVVSLWIGTKVIREIEGALWLFSISRALSYIIYMGLSYLYAERDPLSIRGR